MTGERRTWSRIAAAQGVKSRRPQSDTRSSFREDVTSAGTPKDRNVGEASTPSPASPQRFSEFPPGTDPCLFPPPLLPW